MWLESHANLARHPKTRRLMKRLGWSLPDTIGNLHLFWYWALDFAPTGDLTPYTPEELTADLDLLGASPEQFIEAMITSGFLDRSETSALCIHDWEDYKRPKPRRAFASATRHPKSVEHGLQGAVRVDCDERSSSRQGGSGASGGERNHHESRNNVPAPEQDVSTRAVREPQMVEYEPMGSARIDCVEDTALQGVGSGRDRSQSALRADPKITSPDSSTPTEEQPVETRNENESTLASQRLALTRLNTEPHKLRPSAVGEDLNESAAPVPLAGSSFRPVQTGNEDDFRLDLPANLYRLPGFAKHWWPLYIDFHKKSGTPLTKEARTKFLARLEKEPLTAIAQIKRVITQAVRSGTQWSGVLEHAP